MSFRVRGFLLHLFASFLMAAAAICIVFLVWYPSPLQEVLGVTMIFLILLGVDVVIGPLLTLTVCKQGKKSLKLDLAIIIALQLGAFSYGMYTIAEGRPVWLAFNKDRFDIVRAYEMHHPYRAKAKIEYQKLSFFGPKWVAVRIPDGIEKNNIVDGLTAGADIPQRADFYEPYANEAKLVGERAHSLAELTQYNSADVVKKELAKWPRANAFLPLMSRMGPTTVLLIRETAEVVAIVPLNPWK
jgi:hypothetical protein